MKYISFTKEGLEKIQKEEKELQITRKSAVLELQRTRELGDLSENNAYRAARWKVSGIDRRLRELDKLLRFGRIEEIKKGEVGIGSTVILKNEKEEVTYHVVGGYETDILNGKISTHSPIGKALLAKKPGDTITFQTPRGIIQYTLEEIQ